MKKVQAYDVDGDEYVTVVKANLTTYDDDGNKKREQKVAVPVEICHCSVNELWWSSIHFLTDISTCSCSEHQMSVLFREGEVRIDCWVGYMVLTLA